MSISSLFRCLLFTIIIWGVTDELYSQVSDNSRRALVQQLNNEAWELKFSEPIKGIALSDSAIQLSNGFPFPEKIESYKIRGVIALLIGDFGSAIIHLEESLQWAEQFDDSLSTGKILSNLALVFTEIGDYSKAIEYSLRSLNIMETIGYEPGIIPALSNMGNVYNEQANYVKALEYYLRALALAESSGDSSSLASTYSDIGSVYKNMGNIEASLVNYNKALMLFTKMNNLKGVYNLYNNIGGALTQKSSFKEAREFLNKALEGKKSLEDEQGMAQILYNLGMIYMKEGFLNQAMGSFKQSLELAQENQSYSEMMPALIGLTEVSEKQNNFKDAFTWYKSYISARDSVSNAITFDKINTFQTLYETERKDKEIQLLNKETELQKIEIQQQTLIQRVLIGGLIGVLIFATVFFMQRRRISKEKKRSEDLLLNILPFQVAEEIKQYGKAIPRKFDQVTVMFTDFSGFTQFSENMQAEQLVDYIHACYSEFDRIMMRYGLEKIKTIGDSYMCAAGVPLYNENHAVNSVKAALEIRDYIEKMKAINSQQGKAFFEVRIGLHTGPVVAGVVGLNKFAYDIWGDSVNIASRMESSGEVGKVNVSGQTFELVKTEFSFISRGKIKAKNKGEIEMYFLEPLKK